MSDADSASFEMSHIDLDHYDISDEAVAAVPAAFARAFHFMPFDLHLGILGVAVSDFDPDLAGC